MNKILISLLLFSSIIHAESFSTSKRILLNDVYSQIPKITLYCNATFNSGKTIIDSNGFYSDKFKSRSRRIEWEHVVAAEHFGRAFSSWRIGHPKCITKENNPYKGRRCANKVSIEYNIMQADMYNLYPAIGSVNALRKNYKFIDGKQTTLSKCDMIFDSEYKTVIPPKQSRGIIARVHLYFADKYKYYSLSEKQIKLFYVWDKLYPVTKVECERNLLIEKLQGNINYIMKERC